MVAGRPYEREGVVGPSGEDLVHGCDDSARGEARHLK
jgi:hypothetical protein